jgi:glycosyltransferase involved in cell wall biosynthesis
MENRPRLLRITTVPISLKILLQGQLSHFQRAGYTVLAVSADGPEVESLRAEGIAHHVISFTRKITPFRDLVCLLRLIRLIRNFRPDIVHTHTPKAGLLGMLAAWLCGVHVRMHTVAGLPLMERTGLVKQILILTEKITYGCSTRVYPNSYGLKHYIENFYHSPKLKVIGKGSSNGIDTMFFERSSVIMQEAARIRSKNNIRPDDVVFSFVGRVVKDKGIGELVQAFTRILELYQKDARRVYLLIVGAFETNLDPLTHEDELFLRTNSQTVLVGFQSDIRPYLLASDIFVFPSYREGFPNVVMQACCMKLPCIVSNINGCNEIIQHDYTGLIVQPKNADQLFEAMVSLSADKDRQRSFGARGREHVVANFERQYVWSELSAEYATLLEKNPPGS